MLLFYELKKVVFQPFILFLVIGCVIGNGLYVFTLSNNISDSKALSAKASNIFLDLKTSELADHYIRKYDMSEQNAQNIRSKYEKVQVVIEQKGTNLEALSLYFGIQTPYQHRMLFGDFFTIIIAQLCLLALFSSLFLVSFEKNNRSEALIYATKVGRNVQKTKLVAIVLTTLWFSLVIMSSGLLFYFLRFDYSKVWSDFVSSGFNSAVYEFGKPFITWMPMTVQAYLMAQIVLAVCLAFCFAFLGYVVSLFIRKSYSIFIVTIFILSFLFLLKYFFPMGSIGRALFYLSPIWLWKSSGEWLTDGGAEVLWSFFEIRGMSLTLLLLLLLTVLGQSVFNKKEIGGE